MCTITQCFRTVKVVNVLPVCFKFTNMYIIWQEWLWNILQIKMSSVSALIRPKLQLFCFVTITDLCYSSSTNEYIFFFFAWMKSQLQNVFLGCAAFNRKLKKNINVRICILNSLFLLSIYLQFTFPTSCLPFPLISVLITLTYLYSFLEDVPLSGRTY